MKKLIIFSHGLEWIHYIPESGQCNNEVNFFLEHQYKSEKNLLRLIATYLYIFVQNKMLFICLRRCISKKIKAQSIDYLHISRLLVR
jgi:hypothetical protein